MTILGPTTFYHRTLPPRTVKDAAEYAALGEGWADTPAAFYAPVVQTWTVQPGDVPDVAYEMVEAEPRKRGRPRKVASGG